MSAIVDLSTRQDALRTFLLRRLDNLTKNDKMQITMISTWATELYLDKVPTAHHSNVSALQKNVTSITLLLKYSFNLWLHNFIWWAYSVYFAKHLQINRLLLEDGTGTTTNTVTDTHSSAYRSVVNEFRAFLSDSKDVLDEATTMILLERYVYQCCTLRISQILSLFPL